MKKLICLCVAALTILTCFSACGGKEQETETTTNDIKVIDFDTTRAEENPVKIKPKKNYKITLPKDIIESDFGGNVKAYADTYGYEIIEENGSDITFEMPGTSYSLLLARVGMKVMMELGDIVDSGDFPYVVKMQDYSKDFSYILMLVDSEKFSKATDKETFMVLVSQCGLFYQYHCNADSPECEVVIADSESGKILARQKYTQ